MCVCVCVCARVRVHVYVYVLKVDISHLNADLIGLGWGYLNLLNDHRLVGLPSHCCLAFNDLEGSCTTLNLTLLSVGMIVQCWDGFLERLKGSCLISFKHPHK